MNTPWEYQLTDKAIQDFRRLHPQVRSRVLRALDQLIEDPYSPQLRKLRGREDEWRLRVGDWRIRLERNDASRVFLVLRVLPRGSAYRG